MRTHSKGQNTPERAALDVTQEWIDKPDEMADEIRVSALSQSRKRARWLTALLCLAFGGIAYRGTELVIKQHEDWSDRARRQQQTKIKIQARRGAIVDRNGAALAVNGEVIQLVLNPRKIRETGQEREVYQKLSRIFKNKSTRRELKAHLAMDKAYRLLDLDLDRAQQKKIEALDLPGLRLESRPRRIYPRGRLASHVVGRVNKELDGTLGIEQSLNERLRGHETATSAIRARAHLRSAKSKGLMIEGGLDPTLSHGHTVTLTIDSVIQDMVEQALSDLVARFHPVGASVIVLSPRTGEILALANQPTFDPNHPVRNVDAIRNLAVQAAYEPGSTLKAFTIAAALEEGTITPRSVFDCEQGYWRYTPRAPIRDTHRSGNLTVAEILAQSSNIGTTKIYETIGKKRLHQWLSRFHFGKSPGIELPAATPGLFDPWQRWSDIQGANVSFGQGVAFSPLQVAAAFATFANDGQYLEPTIVASIESAQGETIYRHNPKPEALLRPSTAKTMLRMLTGVVEDPDGTGHNAGVLGYRVAGKTSTAQKAGRNGYFKDQYYASFLGTLPVHDPKAVILVSVDNPEGGHYGNEVAAPTFARISASLMAYWGIASREDSPRPATGPTHEAPDLPSLSPHPSSPRLLNAGQAEVLQRGQEPPLPGQKLRKDPRPKPKTKRPDPPALSRVPNFIGLSTREALRLGMQLGQKLKISGTGVAVSQRPAPGTKNKNAEIHLQFEPIG